MLSFRRANERSVLVLFCGLPCHRFLVYFRPKSGWFIFPGSLVFRWDSGTNAIKNAESRASKAVWLSHWGVPLLSHCVPLSFRFFNRSLKNASILCESLKKIESGTVWDKSGTRVGQLYFSDFQRVKWYLSTCPTCPTVFPFSKNATLFFDVTNQKGTSSSFAVAGTPLSAAWSIDSSSMNCSRKNT